LFKQLRYLCYGAFAAALAPVAPAVAVQNTDELSSIADLFEMPLEELGNLTVISQGRRAEGLDRTPAAVYVVTGEEIRASGVTTLAEALRLAPGVEVARNGTSSWTISMRGFNSDLSNKLLVLIDGRSVYSPLYAGVFWDAQDTLLADINRIEIIAGPGGTIWGANAVNGVINIITRSPAETHGIYAETGAGTGEEAFAAIRYGTAAGENLDARAYLKHFERDLSALPDGGDVVDDWHSSQLGFVAVRLALGQDPQHQRGRGRRDEVLVDLHLYTPIPRGTR
jgi:iron complex outermembrane receptor protein